MGPDDAIDLVFFLHISESYIDSCVFVMLNERDVRELVPPVGLTKIVLCTSSEFFNNFR